MQIRRAMVFVMCVGALGSGLVACSGTTPADRRPSGGPTGSGGASRSSDISTEPSKPAPATHAPTPLPTSPARAGLRIEPGFAVHEVGRYRSTTVVTGAREVAGFDKRARRSWLVKQGTGTPASLEATVDGDVTVVTWNLDSHAGDIDRPGEKALRAIDTDTGRVLWTDTVSDATVQAGTTYVSRCAAVGHDELGTCTVSARDPRTGDVRWTIDAYAGASIDLQQPYLAEAVEQDVVQALPAPSPLVIHQYPISSPRPKPGDIYQGVDPVSGTAVGPPKRVSSELYQDADIYAFTYDDDDPRGGCRPAIRAFDARTGRAVWARQLTPALMKVGAGLPARCPDLDTTQVATSLLSVRVEEGKPFLVNMGTGRTVWSDQRNEDVLAANSSYVVTSGELARSVTVLHRAPSTVFLRVPVGMDKESEGDPPSASLDGSRLLVASCDATPPVKVVDLVSGREQDVGVSGCLVGHGRRWVATSDRSTVTIYPIG